MADAGGRRRFRLPLASWQEAVPLALILAVGAALRFYGLEWDEGQWLHPDERQIYFVVMRLGWPTSLAEALSPASPLNPGFFAYGSLPIYLLALVNAVLRPLWPALRNPENLHLAGRTLAILCDLGSVYLTYRLARAVLSQARNRVEEVNGERCGPTSGTERALALLAAAFVSLAVLHIQIAHFYTADTLLTFLVLLCLNIAVEVVVGGGRGWQISLGIAFGLALATKVSALPAVFVLFVAFHSRPDTKRPWAALGRMVLPLLVALAVFVVSQPYVLIDGRTFVEDTVRESQIARGSLDVPYTVQYAGTMPFVYSAWQTALWGLALPLGLAGWLGFAATFLRWLRRGPWRDALILAWAGPYLVITGLLYAKHLRYMLPLVPVLCIMAVGLLTYPLRSNPVGQPNDGEERPKPMAIRALSLVSLVLLLAAVAYAVVFSGIYRLPHSWIPASEWIYRNVPAGSMLAVEHWDTALPLAVVVDGVPASPTQYTYQTLPLYDEPDDAVKWKELAASLSESDVLILSSRRLYGSIPRLPERYPVVSRYYDLLFAGELGFELVGEFTRGPAWLNPRVPPLPGSGPALLRPDESFVVYDHPRALILRNMERLTADELLRRLGVAQAAAGGGYHPGTGRDRGGGSVHAVVACDWATVARSVVKMGLLGMLDEGTLARTEEKERCTRTGATLLKGRGQAVL